MISSRDVENLLQAYDCCIDEDHKTFFLKMINELRTYNDLSTSPFISSSIYDIQSYDPWINCIKTENICACKLFYERYKLAQKLFNNRIIFNHKNSATYRPKLTCKEHKSQAAADFQATLFNLSWKTDSRFLDMLTQCMQTQVAAYLEEQIMQNFDLLLNFRFRFRLRVIELVYSRNMR
uniref:Uncharacterized protein n=1 Tax=Glossina palpalis gambiensis TaxID=67801 RepID=A0A1B0AKH2_9MUSC